MSSSENKKHPCPDCKMCQWCSERRCEMCRGWLVKPVTGNNSDSSSCDKGGGCCYNK